METMMEGARAMSDAPKEIYYDPRDGYISGGIPPKHPAFASCTPYVRADLSASPEVVKELLAALREARDHIAGSAPDWHYGTQEMLATIDAVLAKLEGGE